MENLTTLGSSPYPKAMKSAISPARAPSVAKLVRARIEQQGERLWRMADFQDQPFPAVAQTLSRMVRDGQLQRLSKGIYYRPGQGSFGATLPNQGAVRSLAARNRSLFPAGLSAANLLGFTTQVARNNEIATPSSSLPRKLIGPDARILTRRPEAWKQLSDVEAAILDFLREGGRDSELSPAETAKRMMKLLAKNKTFARLARAADTEPPRVRALLGALGERIDADPKLLTKLRLSLNPLSRFEFGSFAVLPNAKAWHAKKAG